MVDAFTTGYVRPLGPAGAGPPGGPGAHAAGPAAAGAGGPLQHRTVTTRGRPNRPPRRPPARPAVLRLEPEAHNAARHARAQPGPVSYSARPGGLSDQIARPPSTLGMP